MSAPQNRPTLSVAIITFNEESNLRRALESVKWADEIIIVDSGSTDRTCDIAREYGVKVFVEPWNGFAAQKNSALEKCTGDWIFSLDADEEVSPALSEEMQHLFQGRTRSSVWRGVLKHRDTFIATSIGGFSLPRRNRFLNRAIRYGGFYPDRKIRVWRRGAGEFAERKVHESARVTGKIAPLNGDLIHHAYPTLTSYIEHMDRYSSLGAEMVTEKNGRVGFNIVNILLRPWVTFVYNYFFRLGFLDRREGLLLHLYHAVYVSWKYAKAWELSRTKRVS